MSSDKKSFIVQDMPNEKYHARAENSSTDLRNILKSDEMYIDKRTEQWGEKEKPTKAMEQGTALHTFCLEPEKFTEEVVVKDKDLKLTTKVGKEFQQKHIDKIIIDEDYYKTLEILRDKLQIKGKDIFLNEGIKEASFFWIDKYDIHCKCRPDYLSPDFQYMIDLKSTTDASPRGFKNSVLKFNYAVQAQFYIRGVHKVSGIKPRNFYFIAMEKTRPYHVEIYDLDETWLKIADKEIDEALYRIFNLKDRDFIPNGYTIEPTTLSPPQYMLENEEKKKVTPMNYQEIELF